ncbi:MAG: hypothetical protein GWM90_33465, partial [Gemmatimonadetes bacterium]|nr:hypothetical protein [Gemmatimonadota bacterium]NIQ60241.1 hypothetical protein [Gemmatimonadota bacterium]NIU80456.1 hypothetical protein [Gammaproteobacteria bacterium]NIX48787.1 hypothetical protein [Gemmatimonadota bacterium]NIY13243.1 hypothetical protein [Gemmatimonadota bacterium]
MSLVVWVIGGLVLGALFLRFATAGGAGRERRVLAVGLVVAAAVYVVFALVAGSGPWLVLELGGVLVFAVPAYAGLRWSPLFLAAGWGGHVLWDALLHIGGPIAGVEWYAGLCVGFDPLVAMAVAARA